MFHLYPCRCSMSDRRRRSVASTTIIKTTPQQQPAKNYLNEFSICAQIVSLNRWWIVDQASCTESPTKQDKWCNCNRGSTLAFIIVWWLGERRTIAITTESQLSHTVIHISCHLFWYRRSHCLVSLCSVRAQHHTEILELEFITFSDAVHLTCVLPFNLNGWKYTIFKCDFCWPSTV